MTDRGVVAYNPWSPEVRLDPYPTYARLRSDDPVHYNPYARIFFLTRHADCAFLLRDPRFSARLGQEVRLREDPLPRSMLNSDPPEHTRLREPVKKLFTSAAFATLRGRAEAIANELLAPGIGRRELDLIGDFAGPLVLTMLAEAMGVPAADRKTFALWTDRAEANLDPLAPPGDQHAAAAAARALHEYLGELLDARRGRGNDVMTELAALRASGVMSTEDVLTMATLFVIGGHQPTVHLIGNGVLALLLHRDALRLLRERPGLVRSAVEELLRYDSPIQFAARVSTDEVLLGGTPIPRNQRVVALIGAANRDPSIFPAPDRLDIRRRPNPHLAFGAGIHTCLGAGFARGIAQVALLALLHRLPVLELASTSIEWRPSHVPRGLSRLVVAS